MKKITLLILLLLIVLTGFSKKKERLYYEVGFTVIAFSPEKNVNINTIYLDEAQDIIDSIYPYIYVDLLFELKKSNVFSVHSEKCCFFIEKKKLITVRNGEKKFKRIKEKEKQIFYNLY